MQQQDRKPAALSDVWLLTTLLFAFPSENPSLLLPLSSDSFLKLNTPAPIIQLLTHPRAEGCSCLYTLQF